MKLRLSAPARERIREVNAWWRAKRQSSPALFMDELAVALERIQAAPRLRIPFIKRRVKPIWRVLLPKTEQFVYYSIDDEADEVVIETVWGAQRRRPNI